MASTRLVSNKVQELAYRNTLNFDGLNIRRGVDALAKSS